MQVEELEADLSDMRYEQNPRKERRRALEERHRALKEKKALLN